MTNDPRLPALWSGMAGDPFHSLRKQIDDVFSDFTAGSRWPAVLGQTGFKPDIDVIENEKEFRVTAELPGLTEKDIEVTLSSRTLNIKGEKKSESDEKKDDKGRVVHTIERSYGMFQRSLTVPFDLEPVKVEAEFKNGILTVRLPKPAEMRNETKKIAVKSAASS